MDMTKQLEPIKYFLHIEEDDVKLFGLNAAAVLSVIRAGEKWRVNTNHRNKKANDIAERNGDSRWLSEDVSIGFTNQDFIDRTFGICGRNGVVNAVKTLQVCGVVKQYVNPNKKHSSEKGRHFRFYKEALRSVSATIKGRP